MSYCGCTKYGSADLIGRCCAKEHGILIAPFGFRESRYARCASAPFDTGCCQPAHAHDGRCAGRFRGQFWRSRRAHLAGASPHDSRSCRQANGAKRRAATCDIPAWSGIRRGDAYASGWVRASHSVLFRSDGRPSRCGPYGHDVRRRLRRRCAGWRRQLASVASADRGFDLLRARHIAPALGSHRCGKAEYRLLLRRRGGGAGYAARTAALGAACRYIRSRGRNAQPRRTASDDREPNRFGYGFFRPLLSAVQSAYSRGDLSKMRTLVSPDLVGYFSAALSANASRNKKGGCGQA